jgi:hypothetical protein
MGWVGDRKAVNPESEVKVLGLPFNEAQRWRRDRWLFASLVSVCPVLPIAKVFGDQVNEFRRFQRACTGNDGSLGDIMFAHKAEQMGTAKLLDRFF